MKYFRKRFKVFKKVYRRYRAELLDFRAAFADEAAALAGRNEQTNGQRGGPSAGRVCLEGVSVLAVRTVQVLQNIQRMMHSTLLSKSVKM